MIDNLREVSLTGVHVDWARLSFRNLVELKFKYHASDVMPSVHEFINILANCPDLESLTVLGWGPRLNAPSDGSTSHSSTTNVNFAKFQLSIHIPRLQRFSFGVINVDYAIDLLSLFYLPSLRELYLEDVSAMLHPTDPHNAAPVLEFLACSSNSTCFASTHTPRCCSAMAFQLSCVHSLELHGVHANENTFFRFFGEFTSLRQLSLTDTNRDALHALLPQYPTSSKVEEQLHVPCSTLSKLTCRNVDSQLLADVVTSRASLVERV